MQITSKVVELSPELARDLLARPHPSQRPPRATFVESLAELVARDGWVLNGEAVVVDSEGRLIDGQHRCLAVVAANKSIPVVMVEGVEDRRAYATIDSGQARQLRDFVKGRYPQEVATLMRAVLAYELQGYLRIGAAAPTVLQNVTEVRHGFSTSDVLDYFAGRVGQLEDVVAICGWSLATKLVSKTALHLWAYGMIHVKLCPDVMEEILAVLNMEKSGVASPAGAVHQRLVMAAGAQSADSRRRASGGLRLFWLEEASEAMIRKTTAFRLRAHPRGPDGQQLKSWIYRFRRHDPKDEASGGPPRIVGQSRVRTVVASHKRATKAAGAAP